MPTKHVDESPIYQILVTLRRSDPPIWRRIQVRGGITLARLHTILQIAMGWTDSHIHAFVVGEVRYGVPIMEWPPADRAPSAPFVHPSNDFASSIAFDTDGEVCIGHAAMRSVISGANGERRVLARGTRDAPTLASMLLDRAVRHAMDDPTDDQLTTIAARWQSAAPDGAPQSGTLANARGDIAALLAEITRLRVQLDALTPPAKVGMERVTVCCDQLRQYLVDPDNVIDYWAALDQFLLPVRGGTRSGIVIAYCPWCGSPLPVPPPQDRDRAGAGTDTA